MPVEVFLADRAAFGGDVEFPFVGKNERYGCGKENVPGEHRFINPAQKRNTVIFLQLVIGER